MLRQEDCCEFEANLSNSMSCIDYIVIACLKEKKKKRKLKWKVGFTMNLYNPVLL